MTADQDKAINKIQKLLAMGNDLRANEQERETALRQAYKMMVKHNLDEATVAAKGNKTEARIEFAKQGFSWKWARQINAIIGNMFFCKTLTGHKINGTQQMFYFVGKESNAMTAAVMADWIINSILKEARKTWKQNTAPGTRAFATGAMTALASRVEAIKRAASGEAEQAQAGTALVLASLYDTENKANDDFIANKYGKLRAARGSSTKIGDLNAFLAGQDFGKKINFDNQVTEQPKAGQLR